MKKGLSRQLLWFLVQLRPLFWPHFLTVLLIVLSSLTLLVDPLIVKWLIDVVLPAKDKSLLILASTGIAGVYLCQLVSYAFGGTLSFQTVQKLVYAMRIALFKQINQLSADFHETVPSGEKLYRMEQDADQVAELGATLVPYLLQTTVTAFFVVSTMFVLNFRLTCVLIPLMPIFVFVKRHYEGQLQQAANSAQEKSCNENNFLQEHLTGVMQIQLLRQEDSQTHAFMLATRAKMAALYERNKKEICFRTWYLGVVTVGIVVILIYGGLQVVGGALTVGGFVAFYSYLARLFGPLGAAVDIYSRFNRLDASIRRILEIIDQKPSVLESPGATTLSREVKRDIVLEGVWFGYRNSRLLLTGLDLHIRAGEKIALVGISGSGKSTIAKLIARLYDANRGSVCIGRNNVRDVTLASLRASVCYLPQEPILFDRSIKDNLLLGNPGASSSELWEAVHVAGLTKFILSLSHGWDSRVGPGANFLSGGERQRLALARAVLQRPSIFLLDESTSALDVPSERQAYVNMTKHFAEQTFLFVSHRVSALTWVDRIIVLDGGSIREKGTHDELIKSGGLYSSLCETRPSLDGLASTSPLLDESISPFSRP